MLASSRADRKWPDEFDNRGWRIGVDEFRARSAKGIAYAIPSRRTSGNRVVESILIVKNRAERKASARSAA